MENKPFLIEYIVYAATIVDATTIFVVSAPVLSKHTKIIWEQTDALTDIN